MHGRSWRWCGVLLFAWATTGVGAVPDPARILALPEALRADFQTRVLDGERSEAQRLARLVDYLFAPEGLGMQYQADATYIVADAYATRRANCLSFTLLTVALAREAGLDAHGQEIAETLAWRRIDQTIYRSNHVNAGVTVRRKRLTVDVAWDEIIATEPPRAIDDARLFAHYYNNRAVDLMQAGDIDAALAHAEASLVQDAGFATSWSNRGVLQRKRGDEARARADFEHALALDPAHPGALSNLAMQLRRDGEAAGAEALLVRLEMLQSRDPLHQFLQALDAERSGDFERAADHYRHAIRLHEDEHSFHFGLARAYLQLGRDRAAARALERARALSDGAQRQRYAAKLAALRAGGS
ncbi:MAG TPA: tetratricopeptide repeat protein [Patescibacteria group bacterium]|nr:tetratricopeptide repeat protein [Patescibacteria group bacterium]